MNEQPSALRHVRQWIVKADHDLKNAEHTLTLDKGCPLDTVCFHAQQCAEKYLKALLVWSSTDFPKTHDLVILTKLATGASRVAIDSAVLQPLNRYVVEARYPGDWDPITRIEAEEAVELAKQVRDAVRAILPGEALQSPD